MAYKLIVFLFLIGCGKGDDNDWIERVAPPIGETPEDVVLEEPEPELRELLDDFLHDCGEVYNVDIKYLNTLEFIRFGDPSDEENPYRAGACTYWKLDEHIVKSNIVVMKLESKIRLKALVYHELAHCIMGIGHAKQTPYSIMSPVLSNDEDMYEKEWDSLVEEMCNSNE